MPRPEVTEITFTIDGREVRAPENTMLVDAAKLGDVEIPVFCYEPKLGQPVGACRMCLVEIEGIPKLQTGCSTPVKDGMVVNTATDKVREAQQAVVEFLLINHPLDCPVCDKGGECPLQDISYGWGGGRSRFIEPKRHFVKPLALSPLIAIDRERCILCYRCVRFSQEVAEDYQLILRERGADSYVATFDGHPYVAPFSGNIIELCPVGALTSRPYRFRARPWDIEGAGSVCTLCPSQCNVTFTVRDERVLRVLGRDHDGVDDGWLCDKGRFAYQAIHADERITQPMVRDGGTLRPTTWERALDTAASGLRKAGANAVAFAGGEATNEEGFLLQRLFREGLGSGHVDSQRRSAPRAAHVALGAPDLQASVPDLEFAHSVLVLDTEPVDDAPILDLRLRKGARRQRVQLAIATPRPSSLDASAASVARYAPGQTATFAAALASLLEDDSADVADACRAAGTDEDALRALATTLRAGPDVVILYGERALTAAPSLLRLADALGLRGREGAGLLQVPSGTNGRGLREAGVLPDAAPGLAALPGEAGADAAAQARGLAAGDFTAAYLLKADPLRDLPDRAAWEAGLAKATTVVAHAEFLTDGIREHATVVFPAETYAEKEGTITHPDGRVQRLRPAIRRAGEVRAEWQVLAEVARRAGLDLGLLVGPQASKQLFEAVPMYAGLTLEELGGRGVRWTEREQASSFPSGASLDAAPDAAPAISPNGRLRLGHYRSIWAAPQVEASPALAFLHPQQKVELSPVDAERLGVRDGDRVVVGSNGHRVEGVARLRQAMPVGSVFVEEGIPGEHAGNVLVDPDAEVARA